MEIASESIQITISQQVESMKDKLCFDGKITLTIIPYHKFCDSTYISPDSFCDCHAVRPFELKSTLFTVICKEK